MLLPVVPPDSEPFWAGCLAGELRVPRCPDTGRLIWPPRPMSPWGDHRRPEWTTVSGRGRVWSFIVPHPPLLPDFMDLGRFNAIVVELAEDPTVRMVGNLVAAANARLDSVDADTIVIGEPVRVVFDDPVSDPDGVQLAMPRWVRDGQPR